MRFLVVLAVCAETAACSSPPSELNLKCYQFYTTMDGQVHSKWANVKVDEEKKVIALSFPENGKTVEFRDGVALQINGKEAVVRLSIDDKQIKFGEAVGDAAQLLNGIDRITGKAILLGEGFYSCERGTEAPPKPKF